MNLRTRLTQLERAIDPAPKGPFDGFAQRMRMRQGAGAQRGHVAPAAPIQGSLADRMRQRAAADLI